MPDVSESPGPAGARSNAERCGDVSESPGPAGARSNAERCGDVSESPGPAGARSNAERCGDVSESPGPAGARSNAERCGDVIDLRDRRGRLIRFVLAVAIGAVVSFVTMQLIASVSISPNSDPVGGSSVILLAIAIFVVTSAAALTAISAVARRLARRAT